MFNFIDVIASPSDIGVQQMKIVLTLIKENGLWKYNNIRCLAFGDQETSKKGMMSSSFVTEMKLETSRETDGKEIYLWVKSFQMETLSGLKQ